MTAPKIGERQMTHKEAVSRVASWVKNSKNYPIVIKELSTSAGETPDVIAFHGGWSIMIECKVSRSDFLADKNKVFRRLEDYGMGDKRYFAAPAGLIKPEEVPDGWGLLEIHGRQIRETKEASNKEANKRHEITLLVSAMRRLELATCVFIRQEPDIEK